MREATSSSNFSRGVSSNNRTSGSISGLKRTTWVGTVASAADTRGSRDRKPKPPSPRHAAPAEDFKNCRRVENILRPVLRAISTHFSSAATRHSLKSRQALCREIQVFEQSPEEQHA